MFSTSFRLFWNIVIACILLAGSTQSIQTVFAEGDTSAPESDSSIVDPPVQPHQIFLPMVDRQKVFFGRVTFKGEPAANIRIDVYITYDNWETSYGSWSTDTNSDGYYMLNGLPPVSPGTEYSIEWNNIQLDYITYPYLTGWMCEPLKGLPTDKYQCDFDIQDVALVSPKHAETVDLPYTFTWYPRTNTNDQYEVSWWNPDLGHFYWTPKLLYTAAYTLTSIPDSFLTGVPYNWTTDVYGYNGVGISYWYRWVTFNDHGSLSLSGASPVSELLSAADGDSQAALRTRLKRLEKTKSHRADE